MGLAKPDATTRVGVSALRTAIFLVPFLLFLLFPNLLVSPLTLSALRHPRVATVFPPPLAPLLVPNGAHDFTVPALLAYYHDRPSRNSSRLLLLTAGVMMRVSERFLNVAGCLLGDDVYPADQFVSEVIHCSVPRALKLGERLVPVLAWDDRLKTAAAAPMKLATGVVAEIRPGDIRKLPRSVKLHGKLKWKGHQAFRLARSDVRIGPSDNLLHEESRSLPRYRLCLMTMVAPNSHMLPDWVSYHRRIGVDHVTIFDNGASLDLKEVFKDRADVEIVDWPYHKAQQQAVSMFLFAARARCERVLLEDSDEYPMFGLGNGTGWREDLPLIRHARLMEEKGFLHFKLLHIVMVNSGFVKRPQGEIPMNFVHRRANQVFRNGKSVCLTDQEWQAAAIHHCGYINGRKPEIFQLDIHEWGAMKMKPEEINDPAYLMHFRDRSWEEYVEKWDAGRVSGKLVNDERAGSMSVEKPDDMYMRVDPKMMYTHFRDKIYQRVMREGSVDEQTLVQWNEGKKCERLYKIVGTERWLIQESCE